MLLSPSIPHLLISLNTFRRCLNEDTDLSYRALITKRIGSIMGCLLKESSNLLQMVDKKYRC